MVSRLMSVIMAYGLGTIFSLAAAPVTGGPTFEAQPCDLPGVTPELEPRLRCGTVAVPRERGSPNAGSFRLAVVIIRTETPGKQADPVVYVSGGPGAPLTARASLIARHEAAVLAPDRDLILVDQRGSGRSEPQLCPDLAEEQLNIFASGADQHSLVRAWRHTYGSCRLQMADDGVKPEWFGSPITADDFDAVRQALGIDRWTIYALSYGTAVGMTMMALHPEHLRAVVLDSVFPPDPLPMTLPQSFSHALDTLFAGCRNDPACVKAHPDLAGTYDQALRGLDAEPLAVPMHPGLGVATFRLRAAVFRLIVDRLLYARPGLALLPSFIEAARDRRPAAMQPVIERVAKGYAAMSLGDMAAVECRERPSWRTPESADDVPLSAFVPGMCANWSMLGPPPSIAKNSVVPSLLLAGSVDPITPPPFARTAANVLGPKATIVEFANVGHGVQQSSPCGEAVVTAFIKDPSRHVEAACATRIAPVSFQ